MIDARTMAGTKYWKARVAKCDVVSCQQNAKWKVREYRYCEKCKEWLKDVFSSTEFRKI